MSVPARSWQQLTGRVTRQLAAGAGHWWLDIELPGVFETPLPGQFVQLLMPPYSAAALLGRPMSVAAATRRRERLTLGFLYAPIGVGTRALATLTPGREVEVLGPLGRGFPLDRPGTPVLVAGGRGVAPLLFAASALARAGRRCEFLFGARDARRLVGVEDAKKTLTALRGKLHLCTDDGSRGLAGTVVDLLANVAPRMEAPLVLHACGPHGMLGAVAAWATKHGVPSWHAMESVMGCGTGVCRGCPLPRSAASSAAFDPASTPSLYGNREWAMCCTEGPVFEAAALDWARVE